MGAFLQHVVESHVYLSWGKGYRREWDCLKVDLFLQPMVLQEDLPSKSCVHLPTGTQNSCRYGPFRQADGSRVTWTRNFVRCLGQPKEGGRMQVSTPQSICNWGRGLIVTHFSPAAPGIDATRPCPERPAELVSWGKIFLGS